MLERDGEGLQGRARRLERECEILQGRACRLEGGVNPNANIGAG